MTGKLDITPAELRKQARDLRDFAGDLRTAGTSAASRDVHAYGAIGLAWAWTMNGRFDAADQFTAEAAHAAERVADELDAMATDYESQEHANASGMDQISGELS